MALQDEQIIDLYWDRSERAISETTSKYQRYLMKISMNILKDEEDSMENVNDTYLRAWNSMPPERPAVLSSYLGKINRDGAIDIYRKKHSAKRGSGQYSACLDELEELVSGREDVSDHLIAEEMVSLINRYLGSLPPAKRAAFIGRYFYSDSLKDISSYTRMSEGNVKVTLHRCRQELRALLQKEGYTL